MMNMIFLMKMEKLIKINYYKNIYKDYFILYIKKI